MPLDVIDALLNPFFSSVGVFLFPMAFSDDPAQKVKDDGGRVLLQAKSLYL